MHRSLSRRGILTAALGGAALAGPLAPAARAAPYGDRAGPGPAATWPDRFPLPNGFRPEGITIGSRPYAYFGSMADGSVLRVALATGAGRVLVAPRGAEHPVIGLTIDRAERRLFLAGGAAREIRVADAATGGELRHYGGIGAANTFVNDVVLTPGAAWFTDSFTPHLFRLPLGRDGAPGDRVEPLPLTGDWEQGPSFAGNGICRTPDGRALIVANATLDGGSLVRVDPATGVARRIDTGTLRLPAADGLLLRGRVLYVVQQFANTVNALRLDRAGTRAREIAAITDPRFRVPTTVAAFGDRLYLPNARFDVAPAPDTEYDAVAVRQVRP
ncbi:SMP-30/gluconolactonase/LRE family protein [Streptomyces sp. NPDC059248]|uniref:SMP-30/gluconolactonase/LRE family protein n=1 Tax=Streptomyces sp. NPDC059248 TaxID=3346791 RepID=UPI0036777814